MAWIYLIIASLGEIFGVMSINLYLSRRSYFWIFMLVVSMGLGFLFLSIAMRTIPLGTAYAVWTGLGATGAVLMGIVFFKEPASVRRMFFLTCIIAGAVGLRLVE